MLSDIPQTYVDPDEQEWNYTSVTCEMPWILQNGNIFELRYAYVIGIQEVYGWYLL